MNRNVDVRTYRAASMHEALLLVRRELGPEASILHTREVNTRRLFGLVNGPRQIEVTASAGVNVASRLPQRAAPPATPLAPAQGSPTLDTQRAVPLSAPMPATRIMRDGRPLSQSGLSLAGDGPALSAASALGNELAAHGGKSASPAALDVQSQLDDLHSMVKELCRRTQDAPLGDLPDELFRLFTELLDADLSEEVARGLIDRLRGQMPGGDFADRALLKARIARMIEAELPIAGPIAVTPGRCRLAALVGPTGVGKTTTVAKLAAIYRLREKRRVGLITVDTYRIAAVEQLRTYADIIDLPMFVVSTPREMREAVTRMQDLDLVLMDTAGRSPRDEVKIQELKAFLSEAAADEVHLVLSSVGSQRTLEQTAERFATVGVTRMVLTKLDEAPSAGHILPLAQKCRLPISYLTNGQNVPEDIESATAARVANMILGN